jgi:hypothetical protein
MPRLEKSATKIVCNQQRKFIHLQFSRMSDCELLRFGVAAKYKASSAEWSPPSEPDDLELQLSQARVEWNRRHPDLPLRDSF